MTDEDRPPVSDHLTNLGAKTLGENPSPDARTAFLDRWIDHLDGASERRIETERNELVRTYGLPANEVDAARESRSLSVSDSPADELDPEIAEQAEALVNEEPNLLDAAYSTMRARGLVGETKNAKTLFLGGVGGCLGDPVHVALHGDSSSGKNEITRRVLELLPDGMVYKLTGMSTHALEYRGGSVEGVIVIQELHGQADAQYQLREAMSEGRLTRWTVDESEDGGMEARELEVEIDASIVTTTTEASLHPENATRVFTLEADSSADQTRAVLDEIGNRAERRESRPDVDDDEDVRIWREAIRRLDRYAVVVPFASELAEALPARMPRARRDLKRVLSLIRASALLHQRQREELEEDLLLADVADYRVVYPLLDEVLEPTMTGLTDTAEELIKLHNELATDRPGGWVKRADLEDEAGKRSIASPNTVRRWAKELSQEGLWEGERREHNAWWHRQVHDPDSGAVNLPDPDGLDEEVIKGSNTSQTEGGNRKGCQHRGNRRPPKATNHLREGKVALRAVRPVGNPGNGEYHPGEHGGDDLPPSDWDPFGSIGNLGEGDPELPDDAQALPF